MGQKRRLTVTLGGLALVAGLFMTVATPAAATKPPTFFGAAPGSVTCSLSAKVSLSPPLTNTGGGTNPSTISAKLSGCTPSEGAITITNAKATGSYAASPYSCVTMAFTGVPVTLSISWKAKLNGTVSGTTYAGKATFLQTSLSGNNVTGSFADTGTSGAIVSDMLTSSPAKCSSPSGLKKIAFSGTIVLGSVTTSTVSCCLAPPETPDIHLLEPAYYLADPSLVSTSPTTAEAYATNCIARYQCTIDGNSDNIPSYSFDTTAFTYGPVHDALPTPPSWYGGSDYLWAPSVRFIDGQYLMVFSASPAGGGGNCVGMATSSDALTFTPVDSFELCDSYFIVDPYLFVNPNDGTVWLYYSDENGNQTGTIEAQQLSADGMSLEGSPTAILSYSQVSSLNPSEGSAAYLENPAFVADPDYGYGYDLLDSLGTWNDTDTYATIEVPCSSDDGGCQPSQGQLVMGPAYGDDPGSASLLSDGSPAGNVMIWDQWINGARVDFAGPTTAY